MDQSICASSHDPTDYYRWIQDQTEETNLPDLPDSPNSSVPLTYAFSMKLSPVPTESAPSDDSTPNAVPSSNVTTLLSAETTVKSTHDVALTTFQSTAPAPKKKYTHWTPKEITALRSILNENDVHIPKIAIVNCEDLKDRSIGGVRAKAKDLRLGIKAERKKKNISPIRPLDYWSFAELKAIETICASLSNIDNISNTTEETKRWIAKEVQRLSGSHIWRSPEAISRYIARHFS